MVFFTFISAQNVPNGGFETWVEGAPENWITINTQTIKFMTQLELAHSGTYAIKGQGKEIDRTNIGPDLKNNGGGSGAGFSITQSYQLCTFYYRFDNGKSDKLGAFLVIRDDSGNTIATGSFETDENTAEFAKGIIPIKYSEEGTATTCAIQFLILDQVGGGAPGTDSYFIIDDVKLSLTTGNQNIVSSEIPLDISPQPAADKVNLKITSHKYCNSLHFVLFDLTGKKLNEYGFDDIESGVNIVSIDVASINHQFFY